MPSSSQFHPHLVRQLRSVGATPDTPPTLEQWRQLLHRVSDNYHSDDQERKLQDRAWELSSEELRSLYDRLASASATELSLERDRLTAVIQTTDTGLCLIDEHRQIVEINSAAAEFLKLTREDALDRDLIEVLWPSDTAVTDAPFELHAAIIEASPWNSESVRFHLAENRTATCSVAYTPLAADHDNHAGGLLSISDLTAQHVAAAAVEWRASHDALTGLANRAAATQHIDSVLRSSDTGSSLLFIDLDQFKNVNDTSGHDIGDTVLVEASNRIVEAVGPANLVGRLGGDEFIVFLTSISDVEVISQIARKVLAALRLPFYAGGQLMHLSASIGFAVSGESASTSTELLRNADIALYRAKAAGRDQAFEFDPGLRTDVEARVSLDRQLRTAVGNRELTVAFQALADLTSGRTIGFETLARWPGNPTVGPATFIPIAEENGLISAIGEMALREAVAFAADQQFDGSDWPARGSVVAVNVSGMQLARGGFARLVARTLTSARLPSTALMIELTESTLLSQTGTVLAELRQLSELGVRIALDDFGTGWSSLSVLHQYPIACLKIDRSFVTNLATNDGNEAIVQAVIDLGRALGHTVIAEGVESAEQAQALLTMGCTIAQGYYFGRPATRSGRTVPVSSVPTSREHSVAPSDSDVSGRRSHLFQP